MKPIIAASRSHSCRLNPFRIAVNRDGAAANVTVDTEQGLRG
jgi:hypothetical protein